MADKSRIPELLRKKTTQAGLDLFAAYGIELDPTPVAVDAAAISNIAFVTVAGFANPHFSGFVGLGTTHGILRRSNSTASSSRDWTAELANQLLGRIKNRLLKDGIVIQRVPTATIQGCPPFLFCMQTSAQPVALTDHQDTIFIWIESGPSLAEDEAWSATDTAVLGEGEFVLF